MGKTRKCRLPNPRIQYFVGEPVVVMPLAAVETMHELLIQWNRRERLSIQDRAGLDEKMQILASEVRREVKQARQYYRINSSYTTKTKQTDDAV